MEVNLLKFNAHHLHLLQRVHSSAIGTTLVEDGRARLAQYDRPWMAKHHRTRKEQMKTVYYQNLPRNVEDLVCPTGVRCI